MRRFGKGWGGEEVKRPSIAGRLGRRSFSRPAIEGLLLQAIDLKAYNRAIPACRSPPASVGFAPPPGPPGRGCPPAPEKAVRSVSLPHQATPRYWVAHQSVRR